MEIFGLVQAGQAMDMMVSMCLSHRAARESVKYCYQKFVLIYALEVKKETGFS
jgi:hypothetical protein